MRLSIALSCLLAACTTQSGNDIDAVIQGVEKLPVLPPKHIESAPMNEHVDGDYQCSETEVDEVRQYDQLLGQLALGDVMWPGALLRGDSVQQGRLTPIGLARGPLTFSVSLESLGAGKRSATLDSPSLSSYRDAVGQLLAQEITGSTPARISAEIEEVDSEQQLAVALGADVSAPIVANVKAGFNFSDMTKRSRYIVKFYQLYYTVDVDPPASPHDFFAASVTADDVAASIGANNPPVYVSSIGYGRQVVFTFESELSSDELSAALSFVYQGGANVSGSVSLTHQEVLSHTRVTAFILGGNAGEAASASIGNYDQLKQFIAKGGNFTKDSPGAAIAYKLAYVRDNEPVQVSYASQYQRQECTRVTQKVHVVVENIACDSAGGDDNSNLEVYGSIYAYGSELEDTLVSWDRDHFAEIAAGKSYPTTGIVGEAIIAVTPQPNNSLVIGTSLMERDDNGDDSFGDFIETALPFEAGWRRTVDLNRSSGTQQIHLHVTLTPVP